MHRSPSLAPRLHRATKEWLHSSTCARRCLSQQSKPPPVTVDSEEFAKIKAFAKKLVDTTVKVDSAEGRRIGWKDSPGHRVDEMKLSRMVQAVAPSQEKILFEGGGEFSNDSDLDNIAGPIESGSWIEVRRHGLDAHGVALFENYLDHRWYCASLMPTGELWYHRREDVVFSFPSFVPKDLAVRCGEVLVPENPTERLARMEILKKLRAQEGAVQNSYLALVPHMNSLYDRVCAEDPEKWASITVQEAAKLVAPGQRNSTSLTLLSVHKFLMKSSPEFVADAMNYKRSLRYDVLPRTHRDIFRKTMELIRDDGYLEGFGHRARSTISSNKKRAELFRRDPATVDPGTTSFDERDATIIQFLINSLTPRRSLQKDMYTVPLSRIIRCIGLWDKPVVPNMAYEALVELGVLAPWEDLTLLTRNVRQEYGSSKYLTRETPSDIVVRPLQSNEHGGVSDRLASIRHDWGNLPVYVIDNPDASELDDGISIEVDPSNPNVSWLHVHIADPASLLHPGDTAAIAARRQLHTAYLPYTILPMLPEDVINKANLGSASKRGLPDTVMTFSYKVDADGDIVDYQIRPGLVRRVHIMSYDQVDVALNQLRISHIYPFGDAPPAPSPPPLPKSQVEDLRALDETTKRLIAKGRRFANFNWIVSKGAVEILDADKVPVPPVDPSVGRQFTGFPKLRYCIEREDFMVTGSHRMVAEAMKGACRVGSRFCRDRGIPALRRGSTAVKAHSDEVFANFVAARDEEGRVNHLDALRAELIAPETSVTTETALHWSMGIAEGEGYTRVTSPLRRFSDLYMHWQIQHALLNPSAPPLFSEAQMLNLGRALKLWEVDIRRWDLNKRSFWMLLYMKRFLESPRRQSPNPLQDVLAYTTTMPMQNTQQRFYQVGMYLPELGINAMLLDIKDHRTPIGTILPVDIVDLSIGGQSRIILRQND